MKMSLLPDSIDLQDEHKAEHVVMPPHHLPRCRGPVRVFAFIFAATLLAAIVLVLFLCLRQEEAREDPEERLRKARNHYSVNRTSIKKTSFSIQFVLDRDPEPDFSGDIVSPSATNIESLHIVGSLTSESDHVLHLALRDRDSARWEIPFTTADPPDADSASWQHQHLSLSSLGVTYTSERFSFSLLNGPNGSLIVSTADTYFRYMTKYVSFELLLPSQRLLGLGERMANISLREGSYTLFPRDQKVVLESKHHPGHNLYGMHPFLLYQLPTNSFAGLYLRQSTALQVDITMPRPGHSLLRYSAVGGIVDLYVLHQGPAQFILRQYHQLIGKPALPPLWALGHIVGPCHAHSLDDVQRLLKHCLAHNIPVDGLLLAEEILESGRNFVLDSKRFDHLKEFVEQDLQPRHVHLVATIKGGLNIDAEYSYYTRAVAAGSLVKRKDHIHVGKDASGFVGYPNFWSRFMTQLWSEGVRKYQQSTSLDGLLLTGNEFSNECNGDCNDPLDTASDNDLPYVPGTTPLNTSTLSMDANYTSVDNVIVSKELSEFNVHSLNCLLMANCTYQALNSEKRQFVMSRSTYPGIQKFAAAHFWRVPEASWDHFRYSIPAAVVTQIFGLPLFGVAFSELDHGFEAALSEAWAQFGAFLPVSLNLDLVPDYLHLNSSNASQPSEFKGVSNSTKPSKVNETSFANLSLTESTWPDYQSPISMLPEVRSVPAFPYASSSMTTAMIKSTSKPNSRTAANATASSAIPIKSQKTTLMRNNAIRFKYRLTPDA